MNILLIGREGQLAFELERTLACLGSVIALGRHSTPPLDLENLPQVSHLIRELKPDLLVNAAAYTAVDKAESDPDSAFRINAEAVGHLALEARRLGIPMVHYSTDYVFDGHSKIPYTEDDPTGPVSVYGRSKLAGENVLREVGIPHLIFRTAWVFGLRGQNFLLTMLRLMRERDRLGIVDDQWGAPTWARLIAEGSALALSQCLKKGRIELGDRQGTYHLTASGHTSWFGFAEAIRRQGIASGLLTSDSAVLGAIPTTEYPTPATRPAFSVLSSQKFTEQFGLALPSWEQGLELCMAAKAL